MAPKFWKLNWSGSNTGSFKWKVSSWRVSSCPSFWFESGLWRSNLVLASSTFLAKDLKRCCLLPRTVMSASVQKKFYLVLLSKIPWSLMALMFFLQGVVYSWLTTLNCLSIKLFTLCSKVSDYIADEGVAGKLIISPLSHVFLLFLNLSSSLDEVIDLGVCALEYDISIIGWLCGSIDWRYLRIGP